MFEIDQAGWESAMLANEKAYVAARESVSDALREQMWEQSAEEVCYEAN
jgi:hypothetical protein